MVQEDSFLALVHSDGEIKHRAQEGVKFTDKNPTNVFIMTRTHLVDLQHSIQRRICRDGRKRLGMIYYRIPISVVAQGVKYGCFAIEADEDLQVLFHCRRQFPEVWTTELFVEMLDPLASSGGSAPNPHSAIVELLSRPVIQGYKIFRGDRGCCCSSTACSARSACGEDPKPPVDKALRADDSDDEPAFFEGDGDSDDDIDPVPTQQGGAFSSGT
ncbi:hypothetical protein PIB30_074055 [Stylosanthes scabra]|uniref:Uncharacterized protein n=1 Tax=Stylosanthes scabra TaxID=79078 RepID=A0ABU6YNF3_9FABA|nr:hypothetical protein [Stylosanthes scabra]